jgi:hypothetical protein
MIESIPSEDVTEQVTRKEDVDGWAKSDNDPLTTCPTRLVCTRVPSGIKYGFRGVDVQATLPRLRGE